MGKECHGFHGWSAPMSTTLSPAARRYLAQLRDCDRSCIKLAELGGDGNDVPFEQAFSNLAHAFLRDKAPSLLDHELGFQLLDRDQENKKAVGVMGFKVGSSLLLAPIFFLQGEIKGHELLYLKNQDLFVPLKENWLNYILNRKPNILGEGVNRDTQALGVTQPDINQLSDSPNKFASVISRYPAWLRPAMPVIAYMARPTFPEAAAAISTELHKYAAQVDLHDLIQSASLPMLDCLVATCQRYPKVAAAFDQWYGLESLEPAIKRAGERARVASVFDATGSRRPRNSTTYKQGSVLDIEHPEKTGALRIITYDLTVQTTVPRGLNEEDAEKLLRDRVLIKDERGDDAVSVEVKETTGQTLFNPTETGLYQVLVKPGKFEKCFIAYFPYGPNGREQFCTVVRVGDKANWINIHPSRVWCESRIVGDAYDDWFNGLRDATSLTETDKTRYILIGARGHCTCPFSVKGTLGDAQGASSYEVDFRDYCNDQQQRSALTGRRAYEDSVYDDGSYSKYSDGQRIHLDAKGGTALRSSRGDVYVPTGTKLLNVEPSKADSSRKGNDGGCYPCDATSDSQSKSPPIRPGNILDMDIVRLDTPAKEAGEINPAIDLGTPKDLQREHRRKTAALKVFHDGIEVQINQSPRTTPLGALIDLVRVHGLREKAARDLLRRAETNPWHVVRTRIKYADPYMTEAGPIAPAFPAAEYGGGNMMGFQGPTMQPQEQLLEVPGMSAANTDPNIYNPANVPDPMGVQQVEQAAATGQKEIFDTAMVGTLLKAVRDDTMVDRYIAKLMAGMDSLGRILFSFYWHGNEFADRYGKADMPELEDSLRNAFEMLGDCILFLKQKTIEPYPEEGAADLDLEHAAAV